MVEAEINAAIETALKQADEQGIRGKRITPFLLERIGQITAGKSLESNIQLVYNNVRLAARIGVCLNKGA